MVNYLQYELALIVYKHTHDIFDLSFAYVLHL